MKKEAHHPLSTTPIFARFKIPSHIWLLVCITPWIFLLFRIVLRQIPYTWEYSRIPFLKDRPIPWRIWYCTDDSIGHEGKVFLPNNPYNILYGGAKFFRPLTKEETKNPRILKPASYCSTEKFEMLALPDSVRLIWDQNGKYHEKWISVRSQLIPAWGFNRHYTFALRTRHNGNVDFFSDPDSLRRYIETRNVGFGRWDPANEPSKPHVSVW